MKYMVGLQFENSKFVDYICENKDYIYEVYFSWGNIPNGRNSQWETNGYTECELMDIQRNALKKISSNGIKLNLLLNANCYGRDSLSRSFFEKIGTTIDYISCKYGLNSVTTTSPLIAKFIKNNFEGIETRASVNMEIGTIEGMEYIADFFDSYYMRRELNRDFEKIKELKTWCDQNCKKLFMLANSGCLNYCSAHNFHDNLVAHESEIAKMDNAYTFSGICHEYLKNKQHYKALIDNTNFIRPEDVDKYDEYFKAAKLATRVHKNPCRVLKSYIDKRYLGNILELLEPSHSIYPYIIENGEKLELVKLDENIIL